MRRRAPPSRPGLASPDYKVEIMVVARAMTAQPGILAIFNDCRAGREAEFETWFQGEHLVERLVGAGLSLRPPP